MQIQSPYFNEPNNCRKKVNFGEAQVNIAAISDSHGRTEALPDLYDIIDKNINNIFPRRDKTNQANVFMNVGDWFICPNKKGYFSDKNKVSADYQLEFYNFLLEQIKQKVPKLESFFVPGNHSFDDGDAFIFDYLTKINSKMVLTNANHEKSPLIKNLAPDKKGKVTESCILEVPDDKNPNKINKVLVLGLTVPGVDFYTPEMVKGLDIIDRTNKKDIQINERDLKNTFAKVDSLVQKFKKENPQGGVVIMAHTGNRIADMLVKNVPDINLIFCGHDHLDQEDMIQNPKTGKNTLVVSLFQNNEKLSSVKFHFDDKGNLDNVDSHNYYINLNNVNTYKKQENAITKRLKSSLNQDLKPLLYISGPEELHRLSTKDVRYTNSYLANLVTDAVMSAIKEHEPDVQIFGILSSDIRQSLPVNGWTNNFKLINLFSGQPYDAARTCIGNIKGSDLVKIVVENLGDNMKNSSRNPLIQYAGVQINKKEIDRLIDLGELVSIHDYAPFIAVKKNPNKTNTDKPDSAVNDPGKVLENFKNGATSKFLSIFPRFSQMFQKAPSPEHSTPPAVISNTSGDTATFSSDYEPININSYYKIAIPRMMFKVPNVETIVKLKKKFKPTDYNTIKLFNEYCENNNYKISLDNSLDTRIIE